ncbi:protein AMN1 homolog [Onthophagus taurus]|uniref:protein AMN1 homolog n=1 Tax=Onthophagus taurus TaxID=166361 RepID=UPI000C1FE8DC|nr:protein AMN1 homolog [Onthophagus taurus]
MSRVIITRSVPSLTSLCTYFVVDHLKESLYQTDLLYLPVKLKDKLLKRFLVSQQYWKNIDFKTILKLLVHPGTKSLNLTQVHVDDEILEIISICRGLHELYLTLHNWNTNSVSTNGLLKLFPCLPHLHIICLPRCNAVDDNVILCITEHCKKLAGLDINSCDQVTSKSISILSKSDQLLWVTLSKTNVCDEGIQNLVLGPSGKYLKELRLNDCSQLSNNVLQLIVEHCKDLEVLVFNDCSRIAGQMSLGDQETHLKNLKQFTWSIHW